MKTIVSIFLFVSLFLISCSKDDDTPQQPQPPIPIESRYLSKITKENGETLLSVEYNADKMLKTISNGNGGVQIRYEYENATISRVYFTIEGITHITDFEYENGTLVSFTQDGTDFPVVYSAVDNSYSFQIAGNPVTLFFNGQNDFERYLGGSIEANFFYEPKFGSLHNINSIVPQSVMGTFLYFLFYIENFNLAYQPLESLLAPERLGNYQNTYDELNGLIESEITSIEDGETTVTTVNYEYIQL